MQVTLEIPDEQAVVLQEQAEGRGLTVNAWMLELLGASPAGDSFAHLQHTDPAQWKRRFEEWVSTPRPRTPPLSEAAISRESIY